MLADGFFMHQRIDIMRYISYNEEDRKMDKIGPYQIEFYETEDGKKPIEEFLDSLGAKTAAKTVALMEVLEE